jgi:glycyl-tRNA synthetase
LGVELKNNIKKTWWERYVHQRSDIVGIDAALIMNPKVWAASGHLENFTDPLVECGKCHGRFREPELILLWYPNEAKTGNFVELSKDRTCPTCKAQNSFAPPRQFNLMFKTFVGTTEESANEVYLRPETAQAMFVDFKNILNTTRLTLPFGVAQMGKAFRNEVTPGNFIYRTREFEQMEIEYFIPPPKSDRDWEKYFEDWRMEMEKWLEEILNNPKKVHEVDIKEEERAHYSKRTIDFEYEYPFGQEELYGLAYRTDFDLRNHFKEPPYKDLESGEEFWPHVIEPTWGVDRSVLVVLLDAYEEEKERVVLHLNPKLAPYKAAIFPLLANKPELVELARKIYDDLRKHFMVAWDDRGNIGKRYFSQDEVGTPWCITVDFQSLEDQTVTVRDRDSMKQERISVSELQKYIAEKLK